MEARWQSGSPLRRFARLRPCHRLALAEFVVPIGQLPPLRPPILVREAVQTAIPDDASDVPYTQDSLCTALYELGTARHDRAMLGEARTVCQDR